MRTIELTFTGKLYFEYWVVLDTPGGLTCAPLHLESDQAEAVSEVVDDVTRAHYGSLAVAVVRVGHTAYNQTGGDFNQRVANAVLEAASRELGVDYKSE